RHEEPSGWQPARLPRLRQRAGHYAGAPSLVARMTLAAVFVVRLLTVAASAASARSPRACRAIAFGGSIVASMMTLAIAGRVLGSGQPAEGVLLRHVASGIVFTWSAGPLSAWFLLVLSLIAVPVAL